MLINKLILTKTKNAHYQKYDPNIFMIYENSEEFQRLVMSEKKDARVFSCLRDYYNFILAGKYAWNDYINVEPYNIYHKSSDTFVVQCIRDGVTHYLLDDTGNKIPTDGMYAQVLFIRIKKFTIYAYCTCGLVIVMNSSQQNTEVQTSCGINEDYFNHGFRQRKKNGAEILYQNKISRVRNAKYPSIAHYKFLFALFHPSSVTFGDIEKSLNVSFTNARKEDRKALLESAAFRKALMETFKQMIPELKNVLQRTIPPEMVANLLKQALDVAVEGGDVKDMLAVFDKITEAVYEENVTVTHTAPKAPALPITALPDILEDNLLNNAGNSEEIDEIRSELDFPASYVMQAQKDE